MSFFVLYVHSKPQKISSIVTGLNLHQADIVPVCWKNPSETAWKKIRKSHFMKAVWEAQKEALRSHCEDVSPDNHVCCPNDPKKRRERGTGMARFEALFLWDDVGWTAMVPHILPTHCCWKNEFKTWQLLSLEASQRKCPIAPSIPMIGTIVTMEISPIVLSCLILKKTLIKTSRPHCDIHSTPPRIHRFPRIVFNIVVSHEAWPLRGHCWPPQVSRALGRCRRDGLPPRLRSPGSGDEELLLRRGGRRNSRSPDPAGGRHTGWPSVEP